MAYNHGKAERKWRLWKEAEEKILRAYGVEKSTIELLYIYDRAEFNSDRRFYRRLNDVGEYIEETITQEQLDKSSEEQKKGLPRNSVNYPNPKSVLLNLMYYFSGFMRTMHRVN